VGKRLLNTAGESIRRESIGESIAIDQRPIPAALSSPQLLRQKKGAHHVDALSFLLKNGGW
jgi:hypothetical protein